MSSQRVTAIGLRGPYEEEMREESLEDMKLESNITFQPEIEYFPFVSVDMEASAVYIYLGKREVVRTMETNALLLIDLDAENNIAGIEILPDKKEVLKYFERLSGPSKRLSV